MNFSKLIKSISRREWLTVGVVSALAALVSAVPPLVGHLLGASRGLEWTGMQVFAPGDFGVYLSYIEQGRAGLPFMKNLFTADPAYPVFNILWFSVGQLAWLSGLSAIAAFHAARTLLIPVLLVSVYVAVAYFLPKTRDRMAAFLMLAFGSGVGLYFAPFFAGSVPTLSGHEWPIDLWVAEANIFASMSYSSHFVASWLLFIVAALFLAMAIDGRDPKYGMIAGAAALILFSFHPFHAPTLYALGFVYLLAERKFRKREDAASWLAYALFVLISAPAVLYHYLISVYGDFGREALAANVCLTPSPWHLLIGFGAFMVLAPAGLALVRARKAEMRQVGFLVVWALVCLTLVYSPLSFQRRLLEGMQFPLAVLAAPAALAFLKWCKSRLRVSQIMCAAILFIVLLLPSSFSVIARNLDIYIRNEPPLVYFLPDRSSALEWIRTSTEPDAAFMSDASSGYHIAGWAFRRVYVGHWVMSGDMMAKMEDARRFFGEMDDGERQRFMLGNGLQYVFFGPDERAFGEFVESEAFLLIYGSGDIEIYRLR